MPMRIILSIIFTAAGAVLVGFAYLSAATIPQDAQEDFGALVRAAGGSMSYSPGFDTAYKQMSADRRMLQQALVGASGAALLAVGAFGLVAAAPAAPRPEA
jgi:hypothetical protein